MDTECEQCLVHLMNWSEQQSLNEELRQEIKKLKRRIRRLQHEKRVAKNLIDDQDAMIDFLSSA